MIRNPIFLILLLVGMIMLTGVKFVMVLVAAGLFQTVFFAIIYKYLDNRNEDLKLAYVGSDQECSVTKDSSIILASYTFKRMLIQVACVTTLVLGFSIWFEGFREFAGIIVQGIAVLSVMGIVGSGLTFAFIVLIWFICKIIADTKDNVKLRYYLSMKLDYEMRFNIYWTLMFNVLASVFFAQFSRSVAFAAVEVNFLGSIVCGLFVMLLYQKDSDKIKFEEFERHIIFEIMQDLLPKDKLDKCTMESNRFYYKGIEIDPLYFKMLKVRNQFRAETYVEFEELLS